MRRIAGALPGHRLDDMGMLQEQGLIAARGMEMRMQPVRKSDAEWMFDRLRHRERPSASFAGPVVKTWRHEPHPSENGNRADAVIGPAAMTGKGAMNARIISLSNKLQLRAGGLEAAPIALDQPQLPCGSRMKRNIDMPGITANCFVVVARRLAQIRRDRQEQVQVLPGALGALGKPADKREALARMGGRLDIGPALLARLLQAGNSLRGLAGLAMVMRRQLGLALDQTWDLRLEQFGHARVGLLVAPAQQRRTFGIPHQRVFDHVARGAAALEEHRLPDHPGLLAAATGPEPTGPRSFHAQIDTPAPGRAGQSRGPVACDPAAP